MNNIMDFNSYKMNESINNTDIMHDVWQQDIYYSTSGELGYGDILNHGYNKSEFDSWLNLYGLTKNDKFMLVTKIPIVNVDSGIDVNANKIIQAYQGVVISESNDGNFGAIMVMKTDKDRAVCLWTYMKNKLIMIGGFGDINDYINNNLQLSDIEKLIVDSSQNFAVLSNFEYLGGTPTNNQPVPGGTSIHNMILEFISLGKIICQDLSTLGVNFKLVPQYGTYTYNNASYYIPELSWFVYSDSQDIIDVIANVSTYPNIEQESIIIKDYNRFGIYGIEKSGSGVNLVTCDIDFDRNPDSSNLIFGDELKYGFSKLMFKNGKFDNDLYTGQYGFKNI